MKHLFIVLLVVCFCSGAPLPCQAESVEGVTVVTAPEVKKLIDDGNALLVNVLSQIEYEIQHIAGSISIPVVELENTDKLPENMETNLVFYCMGKR